MATRGPRSSSQSGKGGTGPDDCRSRAGDPASRIEASPSPENACFDACCSPPACSRSVSRHNRPRVSRAATQRRSIARPIRCWPVSASGRSVRRAWAAASTISRSRRAIPASSISATQRAAYSSQRTTARHSSRSSTRTARVRSAISRFIRRTLTSSTSGLVSPTTVSRRALATGSTRRLTAGRRSCTWACARRRRLRGSSSIQSDRRRSMSPPLVTCLGPTPSAGFTSRRMVDGRGPR